MVTERLRPSRAMSTCQELAVLVTQQTDVKGNGAHKTAIPQLAFMRGFIAPSQLLGALSIAPNSYNHGWSSRINTALLYSYTLPKPYPLLPEKQLQHLLADTLSAATVQCLHRNL